MPLRPPFALPRATVPVLPRRAAPHPWALRCRGFHASRPLADNVAVKNHYERLDVRHDATPAEIKKSFYTLSKTHHPDANRSDPNASQTFSLLSEAYTILSNPSRRAAYDRDVLRIDHGAGAPPRGSYHSTNPAGGRSPSGLSRRRTTFRGPPPSFYRSGGWGGQADKRRKAHEESTGTGESAGTDAGAQPRRDSWESPYGGMGPGADPFGHRDEVPHFDKAGHTRTHRRQDERRWQRERRAMGDDGVEFEPQTSLAMHFLIVAGILGATFLAPVVYLQFMRLGRRKKDHEY